MYKQKTSSIDPLGAEEYVILSKRFVLAFGHCHFVSYLPLPTNFLKGSREQVITEKSQHLIRANKLTRQVDRGLCPLSVPSLSLSPSLPPALPVFGAFFLTLPLVSCVSLFQHWCALFLFLLLFSAFIFSLFLFMYLHVFVLSYVWLLATPRTVACQASLSMGLSGQGDWSGLPFPTPGHLPDPGIKPTSPPYPAWASRFLTTEPKQRCDVAATKWWLQSPGQVKWQSSASRTGRMLA